MVDSGVWKPVGNNNGEGKKLAGPCEVFNLALKSGGGAAVASFYDGTTDADVIPANLKWMLDSSTADADADVFQGLVFKKGVYAVLDQGAGTNPVICISSKKYTV